MNTRTLVGFAVGPVATAMVSLITVPTIAWAFSAEDVGRFNLLQLTVSFIVLFATLGLDQSYVREYHESVDVPALLRSTVAPGLVGTLVFGVPALFFAAPLARALFGLPDPRLIQLLMAASLAALVVRFLSLVLRMEERSFAFSASQVVPKVAFLVVLVPLAAMSARRSFVLLELALLASWLTAVALTAWSARVACRRALAARVNRRAMGRLMKYGFPLLLSGLGYWALTASGSIALRSLSTLPELGIYSVAVSFAGAAVVVQTIFSVVWAPVVYRWAAVDVDVERIDQVAIQLLAVVALLFCAVGTFAFLVELVLPGGYGAVPAMTLATISVPLLYLLSEVTGIGINLTRRTPWAVGATVVALVVSAILNVALVPALGARGAVLAVLGAYVAFFVTRTEASRRVWRPFPRSGCTSRSSPCAPWRRPPSSPIPSSGVGGPSGGHWRRSS